MRVGQRELFDHQLASAWIEFEFAYFCLGAGHIFQAVNRQALQERILAHEHANGDQSNDDDSRY